MNLKIKYLQEQYNKQGEKISVILPCYNREYCISSCLENILNQTIGLENLEIICIDDGSTDNTAMVIQEYEQKFPEQILLIVCDENSGGYVGKVRNIGLSYAQGSYVFFIDSDDRIENDCLEKMYIVATATNSDIVASGYYIERDGILAEKTTKSDLLYERNKPHHLKHLYLNEGTAGNSWSKLIRKDFLTENCILFPKDLHLAEDTFFHQLCLMKVSRYYTMSECLYYYVTNSTGLWNNPNMVNNIMDCFDAQIRLDEIYKKEGTTEILDELEWLVGCTVKAIYDKCVALHKEEFFEEKQGYMVQKIKELYPNILQNPYIVRHQQIKNILA